jgi:bacillithiol system protein YtxJ
MKFWNELEEMKQWESALDKSGKKPVLVFKHSTRCSISQMALDRFERNWKTGLEKEIEPFYLDLLNHRDISNEIARSLDVEHQSPQVLLIKNGQCVYSATHQAIRLEEVMGALKIEN